MRGFRLRLALSWMGYWERGASSSRECPKSSKFAVFSHQRGNCRLLGLVTRPRGLDLRGQDLNFTPYFEAVLF